jgi:4-amino-4-deoxy-L-arabinose transferase-like glycosyltransferase
MTRFGRVLLLIVIAGFGLRVAYVALAKEGPCPANDSTPGAQFACGDQIFYNSGGNALARGHGFNDPLYPDVFPGVDSPPAADHPPLTIVVLAPVSWLLEHPPLEWVLESPDHVREHRYTMVLLGTLTIFLIGLLGRRVGGNGRRGEWVGWVAAAIAAFNPNVWVNDGLVMSETVTVLAVTAALLLAFRLWDRPTIGRALALGAMCGVAALGRAELVLLFGLLAFVVGITCKGGFGDRSALGVGAVAAAIAIVIPWVGFNMTRFEKPTFLSTNDGIALLGSNCDAVFYGPNTGLTSVAGPDNCLPKPPPPGDQSEVSAKYRRAAFDYMSEHKARVGPVVLARVGRTWSVYQPFDMTWFNVGEGREPWVTRTGIFVFYAEMIAVIGGAIVLGRRRNWREFYALAVPVIVVTIGAAVTYGQTRFRAAAEPSLALYAAVGIVALLMRFGPVKRPEDTATLRTDPDDSVRT